MTRTKLTDEEWKTKNIGNSSESEIRRFRRDQQRKIQRTKPAGFQSFGESHYSQGRTAFYDIYD